MLKHSTSSSHYGTASTSSPTAAPGAAAAAQLQQQQRIQTPHPLTSSSHSGGGDSSTQQVPPQHHYQQQQQQIDPTRFLEGPPYAQSFSQSQQSYNKSYLEQSFPSIHASRLYLDPSGTGTGTGVRPLRSSTTNTLGKDLSPDRLPVHQHHQKANGSIYLSPQTAAARHPSPTTLIRTSYSNLHHSNSINPPISHLVYDGHTATTGLQQQHSHHALNLNTTATTTATATSGSGANPSTGTTTLLHSSTLQSASYRHGVLRSLSLLSVLSLLLALNSLVFLLKIVWPLNMSGGGGSSDSEFKLMYEVTLCLAAMCLSINLCVLLITAAQYFFAVSGSPGSTSFLRRVTVIRGVAIGGFFLSIPLFLAALVLYTFTHLSFAIPALITTFLVGVAIILGGCAMVCHVVIWQQEKTTKRALHPPDVSPNPTIELSTLV